MKLLNETVKGVSWIGSFRVASRVVAYGKLAIVARLLTPAQFGVYGIATLGLAFLEIFTETGINTILIQEKKHIDKFVDTAWIISVLRGFVIGIAIVIAAPTIARFFASPESLGLLYAIAIVPVVRGFINPSVVKFQKDLEFHKEFKFRMVIFSFDAVVGVIATFILMSPVGLVWGFVAGAILELILSFVYARPLPKIRFDKQIAKIVLVRGKWITSSGIFQYLFRQGDDIVVGRMLGTAQLGIYQAAYKVSTLPVSEIADVAAKVTFPVFVKIADDADRLRRAFTKSTLVVLVGALGLGLFIYIFAYEIVLILLGRNWLAAVPVVKVLIIFGVIKAVTTSFHSLFLSVKRQQYVTSLTFISTLVLAVSIIPFILNFGLLGAAYSVVISSAIAVPIAFYFATKIFKKT